MTSKCSILFTIALFIFWLFCVKCQEEPEHYFNSSSGVRVELTRQKSGFEQYINNIQILKKKYGIKYFDSIFKKPKPHPPTTNDSIALKRYLDSEFYGEIIVGHPGQKLYVSFDTSWTVSWVMSEKCSGYTDFGCFFHNKYDDSKSPFHIPDGRPYTEHVGKDVYSGVYVYDNISIAHVNVTKQSFVEMEKVPFTEIFSKADGVLGLGLKNASDSYEPFFYKLLAQNKIKAPLFSIYLNRDKQSDRGGNIMLGFIDKKHIHSHKDETNKTVYDPIVYLGLQPSTYWQFKIDGTTFCCINKEMPYSATIEITGIVYPKSLETVPAALLVFFALEALCILSSLYIATFQVNCDTVNKLPRIDITLNGTAFTLKGPDYIIKMNYMSSITLCVSAFVPQDNYPDDFWVLGGAFLSEVYTIYNVNDKKIGFVKAA